MERQKFEKDFKDAFKDAGLSPSDNLWTNIELDLEKAASEKMRRSLLMYKLMAAASIAFAMCIGGAYYYDGIRLNDRSAFEARLDSNSGVDNSKNNVHESIPSTTSKLRPLDITEAKQAAEKESGKSSKNDVSKTNVSKQHLNNEASERPEVVKSAINSDKDGNGKLNSVAKNDKDLLITLSDNDRLIPNSKSEIDNSNVDGNKVLNHDKAYATITSNKEEEIVSLRDRRITTLLESPHPKLTLPPAETVDPVAIMMAKLEQREIELRDEEDNKKANKKADRKENLWTSVGFATGSVNGSNAHKTGSNVASTSSNGFAASNAVADNQNNATGTSYSIGLSMGTKVSERWMVHGGVNYLSQTSSYQANGVVKPSAFSGFRAASISELKAASTNDPNSKYYSTAKYNIDNNLQFVSIPVQAGYMAVNHKVGLQINAGVSTDLFLQSTITPQGGGLEKTTQGRGDESPYRPVNFSGLFGTELSYKLGSHYRFAVNPGLRYPINSIYKSAVGVSSNPITMDIGVRFRYIFR